MKNSTLIKTSIATSKNAKYGSRDTLIIMITLLCIGIENNCSHPKPQFPNNSLNAYFNDNKDRLIGDKGKHNVDLFLPLSAHKIIDLYAEIITIKERMDKLEENLTVFNRYMIDFFAWIKKTSFMIDFLCEKVGLTYRYRGYSPHSDNHIV